ncbi:MAG: hypothetical protein K2Z81_09690 [Cyanobacteria bacterium]|nr:hypothetical protein [Cyanobacteriota bacterium]
MFDYNPEDLISSRLSEPPVIDVVSLLENYRPKLTTQSEKFESRSNEPGDHEADSTLSEQTEKNDSTILSQKKRLQEIVSNAKEIKSVTQQEQEHFNRTSPIQLREFQKSIPGLDKQRLSKISPQLIRAAVDQAIKDICSDKYSVRQKGQENLEAMGSAARMSLALALHQMETSKDPKQVKQYKDNQEELRRRTKSVLQSLAQETSLHVVDTGRAIRQFRNIENTAEGPMIESKIFRTPEQERLGLEIAEGHHSVEKLPNLQRLQRDLDNLPGNSAVKTTLQKQCTELDSEAKTIQTTRPEILVKALLHQLQHNNPDAASRYAISILADDGRKSISDHFRNQVKLIDEHADLSARSRTALRQAFQRAGGDPSIFNR